MSSTRRYLSTNAALGIHSWKRRFGLPLKDYSSRSSYTTELVSRPFLRVGCRQKLWCNSTELVRLYIASVLPKWINNVKTLKCISKISHVSPSSQEIFVVCINQFRSSSRRSFCFYLLRLLISYSDYFELIFLSCLQFSTFLVRKQENQNKTRLTFANSAFTLFL